MTRTQSSCWCLPGAFGSADSDSVQPSEGLMPLLSLPYSPKKMLCYFPALLRRHHTKLPLKGKGKGSKCKIFPFRDKFGAFFPPSLCYGKSPATPIMLSRKVMNVAVMK